jgi:predicted transporter
MLKMAELIWECLIISIVLLFGINIGLAMGLTEIRKKEALVISVSYGLITLILSTLANFLNNALYSVIDYYIPAVLGIIGVVTFLSGIYTINKWRKTKKEHDSSSSVPLLSSSICYFAGFASVAVLLSKEITVSFQGFTIFMVVAVILVLMGFYSFSKILRHAEKPYPVLLGNFMILNGFYFLISAAFVPNIEKLSSMQMSPFSINSDISSMIFLIMAGIGVFLIGAYLTQEGIKNIADIYQKLNLSRSKTKKT